MKIDSSLVPDRSPMDVFANPRVKDPAATWPESQATLWRHGFDRAQSVIVQWPDYQRTPLHNLRGLASRLGLKALLYKDESRRFGLGSFKALGAAYAVLQLLQQRACAGHEKQVIHVSDILAGRHKDLASGLTVTCATDGNHGRSLAWGAQLFGCQCVIYVHAHVSEARVQAMQALGAQVVIVPGNYDDSVRHAASQARIHGWTVVSDTSYDGYRDIPMDVMYGYGVLAREIFEQATDELPTHVIVQAGVGGLAAALCMAMWLHWGPQRARLILVEPKEASCFFRSAQAGHPVVVGGALQTVMAGLACGEVSDAAWEILDAGVSDYVTVADAYAIDAMRALAMPSADDAAIVAGETGVAGLAALLAAREDVLIWQRLGLGEDARVLIIGTEGDTDPDIYQSLVGLSAQQVRSAGSP